MVTKEKMVECGTRLRWVSSDVQIADGVTKTSARQLFADRLRTHQFSLKSDASFQASKKKTMAERQASARRNALGRMVHRQSLSYLIMSSQFVPMEGLSEAFELVTHPDVLLSLLVILLSTLGCGLALVLANRWCSFRPSSYASRSTAEIGIQTNASEDADIRRRCQRVIDLERDLRFRRESEVQRERERRMAAEEVARRLEANLQTVQAASSHEGSHQLPIPAQIHISHSGRRYRTDSGRTALRNAIPKTYPVCSFCANRSG